MCVVRRSRRGGVRRVFVLFPEELAVDLVPHGTRKVSSTRPFAHSCRATCRIKVTGKPRRISSKACAFGHPWRSTVIRFVISKNTVFAEGPRPPHVLKAKGENH